jgi:DNA replication ATP-dependent helicase Dna2
MIGYTQMSTEVGLIPILPLCVCHTRAGDVVNIIGPFDIVADGQQSITVTTLENLLIHHPDTLLTPSLLASAPNCQRRPLITALVRALSPPTPALVYGTVLHDVVQQCLREKRWDARWIEAHVDTALSMAFGDLVRAGVTVSEAKGEILRRAAGVETFGERYIGDSPKVFVSTSRALHAHNHFPSPKLCCLILVQLVGNRPY